MHNLDGRPPLQNGIQEALGPDAMATSACSEDQPREARPSMDIVGRTVETTDTCRRKTTDRRFGLFSGARVQYAEFAGTRAPEQVGGACARQTSGTARILPRESPPHDILR